MLSGATEVRQQPPRHAPSYTFRGALNQVMKRWKWIVAIKTRPNGQKGKLALERKPRSDLKNRCAANQKVVKHIFHPTFPTATHFENLTNIRLRHDNRFSQNFETISAPQHRYGNASRDSTTQLTFKRNICSENENDTVENLLKIQRVF